jgi:PKD repeat protein
VERDDARLNEVANEILIVVLVVLLAVIIAVFLFGVFTPVDKTAYFIPRFGIGNSSGQMVITIFNRGGGPVYFNGSPQAKYKAEVYVDTQSGSFKAVPVPALTVFKPGDMIYAYYNGSGFILTNTLTGVTFQSLPEGKIVVTFVDATSRLTIAQEILVLAVTTPARTAPAVTTPTTVSPTIPAPKPLAANFDWSGFSASGKIKFSDLSTGRPGSWQWNFGDGAQSTSQNPEHRFVTGASYDVTLSITRTSDGETSSITKRITV